MNIKIIVGALIVKKNKFILVQEAKKQVYGKWNLTLGHLEPDEDIQAGAKREAEDETGLKIKLEGLIGIYHHKTQKSEIIWIVFKASVIKGNLKFNKGELLDAKWVSFDEFDEMPDSELRRKELRTVVNDYKTREIVNLDLVRSFGF